MINERLKTIRKQLGLKQSELAKVLNITTRTLQNYEKDADIPASVINKLISLFNVNPTWLLTGQGEMFCFNQSQKNIGINYGGLQVGNIIGEQIEKIEQETKYITSGKDELIEDLEEINQILQEIKAKNPQAYQKVIAKLKQEVKAMKELLDLV